MSSPPATTPAAHGSRARPDFERIALLLQGGGALGSYQAGVYQALAEANLHPDWVAGISIGAINSALIAGNPPERAGRTTARILGDRHRAAVRRPRSRVGRDQETTCSTQTRSTSAALIGRPAVGRAELLQAARTAALLPCRAAAPEASASTTSRRSRRRSRRLVDFDRINAERRCASASARSTFDRQFRLFRQHRRTRSAPEHVMASGSLPPGFPATEIDGEYYWDGGLVSNTPLQWVLDSRPREGHARLPDRSVERARRAAARHDRGRDAPEGNPLFQPHPAGDRPVPARRRHCAAPPPSCSPRCPRSCARRRRPSCWLQEADEKVYNIIQLIYRARSYEGDVEGLRVLAPHDGGALEVRLQRHAVRTLRHPEVLQRPQEPRRRLHLRPRTAEQGRRVGGDDR